MFSTSFSGNFIEKIGARANAWSTVAPISYSIVVPPELAWVLIQEYGVDHSYPISGVNGVAFKGDSGLIIRQSVEHPGFAPTHTIRSVLVSVKAGSLKEEVSIAFEVGEYSPPLVIESLKIYMDLLKQEISEGLSETLKGTRGADDSNYPLQSGKLHGRSASEVFLENATVVMNEGI